MLCDGKLFYPPVKQFDPVSEALTPVIGASNFFVTREQFSNGKSRIVAVRSP